MSKAPGDELADELLSGRTLGVGPAEVTRIDTAAAHVFLVGDRAYKLKRPVRFSFLDFRAVDARRQALERELELNRRAAPELYVAVRKLVRSDEDLRLAEAEASGAAVDWILEMVRFPSEDQLDRIAEHGPLSDGLTEALGRAVVALHDRATPRPDKGGRRAMAEVVAGNREDLDGAPLGVLDPALVARVDRAARAALERLGPLLERRRETGFVRHCHGDLHLANLVKLEGRVVPFDCIEFGEDFACIDIAYDLAFLLMDLLYRGDGRAAQRVLQVVVEANGDIEGLALLPFFMAVRATIRAKVSALTLDDAGDRPAIDAARNYLLLALRLEPPPPPRLIGIGGLSGSGKTTLAKALAPRLRPLPGALVWRSDVVRKQLAGVAPQTPLPASAYTPAMNATVALALRDCAERTLRAGWSAIVDATHREPAEREALLDLARRLDVPFTGLWLDVAADTLVERVRTREPDASDADAAVVLAQLQVDPGPITWQRAEAGDGPRAVLARALAALDLGQDPT